MPKYISPLPLFTATVCVTAILSLTSLAWRRPETVRVERRDMISILCAALLIALLRKGMLIVGLSMTSPIDGSIIATLSPVVVLTISLAMGLERLSMRRIFGVLLGFGGAIGVILAGGRTGGVQSGMVGNLLMLFCAFIAAIYLIWFKRLLAKYDPLTLLRWMFCITAIVVVPFGIDSLMSVDTAKFTPYIWMAVAYLVVMPTYIPNLLLVSGLRSVTPTTSSIYTYLQPTVAVVISTLLGLDTLHGLTALFAALIFSGVALVISAQRGVVATKM